MHIHLIYAHPGNDSFNAELHRRVLSALREGGHAVDDCDLYAESFDPILTEDDLVSYNDISKNRRRVVSYVDRLSAAEGLILIYPVWNEGFPAILKGYLDRVFLPGVSFVRTEKGSPAPALLKIRKFGAVCTYGAGHFTSMILGDPPRRVVKRALRAAMRPEIRCEYIALYNMDATTSEKRAAFSRRVYKSFQNW